MNWRAEGRKSVSLLSREGGQALIETALSSLFLMLLLLGAVEMGMAAYAAIEVANSAKAAAQYAGMNGGAWAAGGGLDRVGMLNAAQADAGNLVANISFTTAPTYSCSCTGAGVADCPQSGHPSGCTGSHLLVKINVETQATYRPIIRFPGSNFTTITLRGAAEQDVLQ
jgi:Flp pilus assembly protein TadG